MMKTRTAVLIVTLFVGVALVAGYTIFSTLQRGVSGDTVRYSATFGNVLGLRVGDDVRMAGIRVGRVDSIELDADRRASVVLRVQSRHQLTTTTKALIRYQNLIGQRYVALAAGERGGDRLPPDGAIPYERTESSFDVSTVLAGFEPLFATLEPDDINSLSQTLVQALQGDGVSLSALVTQAAQLAGTFRDRDEILGQVITNLGGVVEGLANRSGELETLITQTRMLTVDLYEQGTTLATAVEQASGSTSRLADLIARIRPGLAQAQQSAAEGVHLLISNGARLDITAAELPFVLAGLARISGNGAYINSYFCNLDVSLWGVLLPPGMFNQIGGNSQSEVCR
ncbi:MCE family protein [Nocardia asteroides]|uniref:Mce family protein n=1 Tax=Nocardia asteroides NBRC 15531 TaxID=1110697 RepID=U5EN88_NOCAS|nr:MlaD family protein [Nocardia asteroides]GAD86549.1 Mce family protein [Nocardia asteroides NBRC 15531]SFM16778.1 phospholipid/cholesterol/gamma-HCH transport system substrate-binding protein [Nocardia asteroides]VEG35296.1 virulence factor Mce family protein [Nocardia asteroides]